MRSPLRLGIIGLGDFGLSHLEAAAEASAFTVAAIADPRAQRTEELAATYEVPYRFASASDLLESRTVDAVVVVSPSEVHLDHVEMALHHGLPVLVEKPVVGSLSEAARMLELDRQGVIVPAHILRSAEPYTSLHERLRSDASVRIGGLSARRHRGIDHLERFPAAEPVLMTMIHDIDLALWFTGSAPVTVRASASRLRGEGRADLTLAMVTDSSGRSWDLGVSWLAEGSCPPDRLEIYTNRDLFVADSDPVDFPLAMIRQLEAFAARIREESPARVSVAEAVQGIAVAEAIRKSAALGGAEISILHPGEIKCSAGTARR